MKWFKKGTAQFSANLPKSSEKSSESARKVLMYKSFEKARIRGRCSDLDMLP